MKNGWRKGLLLAAAALVAGAGACLETDDICAPSFSANGGLNCSAHSDGCFPRDYRFECQFSLTGGFDCACYLDGAAAGECQMDDLCRSDGVFFEEDRATRSELIYTRMEACCGFDIPF